MSFNVTKKHIDDWYEENRWWADDLTLQKKLRLCKLFYIYQVFEQRKNSTVPQSRPVRIALAKHLAQKLLAKEEDDKQTKILDLMDAFTDPLPNVPDESIHPFFLSNKDINSGVIFNSNALKVNDIMRGDRNRFVRKYIAEKDFTAKYGKIEINDNPTQNMLIDFLFPICKFTDIWNKISRDNKFVEKEEDELAKAYEYFLLAKYKSNEDKVFINSIPWPWKKIGWTDRLKRILSLFNRFSDELGILNDIRLIPDDPEEEELYVKLLLEALQKVVIWNKIKTDNNESGNDNERSLKRVNRIFELRIVFPGELFYTLDIMKDIQHDASPDYIKSIIKTKDHIKKIDDYMYRTHSSLTEKYYGILTDAENFKNFELIKKNIAILYAETYLCTLDDTKRNQDYIIKYMDKKYKHKLKFQSSYSNEFYENMYNFFIEKNDRPILVQIYYDIIYNAITMYLPSKKYSTHQFFVANRSNRPQKDDMSNNYKQVLIKMENEKHKWENLMILLKKEKKLPPELPKYFAYYHDPGTKRDIYISIENAPEDKELLTPEQFVEMFKGIRSSTFFFSDNQLLYFYHYLIRDVLYGTRFTYDDNYVSGVYLNRDIMNRDIKSGGLFIEFKIFKEILEKKLILDDRGNLVKNNDIIIKNTDMKKIIESIKNWSVPNTKTQGFDGSKKDQLINDGQNDGAEPDHDSKSKIIHSIKHVMIVFDSIITQDSVEYSETDKRNYFIKKYLTTWDHTTSKEEEWGEIFENQSGRNWIDFHMAYLKYRENLMTTLCSAEIRSETNTDDLHTTATTRLNNDEAINCVLIAAGSILQDNKIDLGENYFFGRLESIQRNLEKPQSPFKYLMIEESERIQTEKTPTGFFNRNKDIDWTAEDARKFRQILLETSKHIYQKRKKDFYLGCVKKSTAHSIGFFGLIVLIASLSIFLWYQRVNEPIAHETVAHEPIKVTTVSSNMTSSTSEYSIYINSPDVILRNRNDEYTYNQLVIKFCETAKDLFKVLKIRRQNHLLYRFLIKEFEKLNLLKNSADSLESVMIVEQLKSLVEKSIEYGLFDKEKNKFNSFEFQDSLLNAVSSELFQLLNELGHYLTTDFNDLLYQVKTQATYLNSSITLDNAEYEFDYEMSFSYVPTEEKKLAKKARFLENFKKTFDSEALTDPKLFEILDLNNITTSNTIGYFDVLLNNEKTNSYELFANYKSTKLGDLVAQDWKHWLMFNKNQTTNDKYILNDMVIELVKKLGESFKKKNERIMKDIIYLQSFIDPTLSTTIELHKFDTKESIFLTRAVQCLKNYTNQPFFDMKSCIEKIPVDEKTTTTTSFVEEIPTDGGKGYYRKSRKHHRHRSHEKKEKKKSRNDCIEKRKKRSHEEKKKHKKSKKERRRSKDRKKSRDKSKKKELKKSRKHH